MVKFVEKDFNLPKIKIDTKLFNLRTIRNYSIYGLRQESRPPILITACQSILDTHKNKIQTIIDFFNTNGIRIIIQSDDDKNENEISIGLRKDIRKQVFLASAAIQTIVYCLENKIKLSKKNKIPGIPRFN